MRVGDLSPPPLGLGGREREIQRVCDSGWEPYRGKWLAFRHLECTGKSLLCDAGQCVRLRSVSSPAYNVPPQHRMSAPRVLSPQNFRKAIMAEYGVTAE